MKYIVDQPRATTWFAITPYGLADPVRPSIDEQIRNMCTWTDILGNRELRRGYPPFLVIREVIPVFGQDVGRWPQMLTRDEPCIVVKDDGSMVRWDGAGDFETVDVPLALPGGWACRFSPLDYIDGDFEGDLDGDPLNAVR
jgi:hypothetical protein